MTINIQILFFATQLLEIPFLIHPFLYNISGLCLAEFLTRPERFHDTFKSNEADSRNEYSSFLKSRRGLISLEAPRTKQNRPQLDSLEIELEEDNGDEKYLVSVVYSSLGELPAFLFGWVEILINVTAVSACRYQHFFKFHNHDIELYMCIS